MSEKNRDAPDCTTTLILAALALSSAVAAQAPLRVPQTFPNPDLASAPDSAPIASAVSSTVTNSALRLEDYQRQYDEALANGLYGEAETAAKRMIDVMNDGGDHGQKPMARALTRLAFAQRQRQLYESALQNYLAAIELLASSENRLSDNLIDPLRGLGDTYLASGRADLALPVYKEALHVRHVNDGPHTLRQMELLDAIATARIENGEADAALDVVDRMFNLYARKYATDSEEVLPVLERKASLLNVLDRHEQERAVYREIIDIMRNRRGEYDLSLLQPYSAIAHTYFYDLDEVYFRSEPTTETGETFLKKALELTERHPEATWLMREQALIELGDYYTLRDVQDKARIHYRRAWRLLSADESRLDRRRQDLERAVSLLGADLDRYANFGYRSGKDRNESNYRAGYVTVQFTVNDRGRVTDVEIADADPPGFTSMEVRVMKAVRDFIYRPRYANGAPVDSRSRLYRHDYLYRDSDLQRIQESDH